MSWPADYYLDEYNEWATKPELLPSPELPASWESESSAPWFPPVVEATAYGDYTETAPGTPPSLPPAPATTTNWLGVKTFVQPPPTLENFRPGDVGAVEGALAAAGGAGLAAKGVSLMAGPGGKVGATLDIIQGISGLFGQVQQSGVLAAVGVKSPSAAATMEDSMVNGGGGLFKQGAVSMNGSVGKIGGKASRFVSIGRKGYVGQVLSDGSVRVRRAYRPVVMSKAVPSKAKWKRINKQLHDWRSVAIGIINRTGGMNKRRGSYRRSYGHRRRR